jgi:proteic killer suppression protein
MDVSHDDEDLERIENDSGFNGCYSNALVRAFIRVMTLLRNVQHEGELQNWRGLRFKRLQGNRKHQWSARLNQQWRLIIEIEPGEDGNCLIIKGIDDYHR